MASFNREEWGALVAGMFGMLVTALLMHRYGQHKALESFLSCGATCSVDQVTVLPVLFGVLTPQILWALFTLVTGAVVLAMEQPRLWSGRRLSVKRMLDLARIASILLLAVSAYALYAAFSFRLFFLALTLISALLLFFVFRSAFLRRMSAPRMH